MKTTGTPYELACMVAKRSRCHVQVGAVISDRWGRVLAWGWNHSGPTGMGMCAERMALRRANPSRLAEGDQTITVVAFRRGKEITSWPCPKCMAAIIKWPLSIDSMISGGRRRVIT